MMAEVSGKGAFIGLVYMLGLAAFWAWLGYLAGSPWVGMTGLAGTIAIQVALNRAQEQRYSGVTYLEWLGSLWIISAATMAEYSGRWLWTIPWALSGLMLFVIAGITRGKGTWASHSGIVLGLWSMVWAVAGPLWLYGKNQQETRALYGDVLKSWWWVGLLILLALAGLLALIEDPVGRRRQARTGPPQPAQPPPSLGPNPMFGRQSPSSGPRQALRNGYAPIQAAAPPGPAPSAEHNGLLISDIDLAVAEPGSDAGAAQLAAADPSRKAMRTVLLLRPFWESNLTAHQLTIVARIVQPYGKLIAIRNGNEELPAREIQELNVKLIDAADNAWQENAIEYIQQADAVIAHIAPRNRSSHELLKPIVPSSTPRSTDDDLLRELVHKSGSGHGVLLELDYCRRAKAGPKLLVLVPESFTDRLADVLHAVDLQQTGTLWRRRDGAMEALTPRVSALDEALSVLNEARAIITYKRFGDPAFCTRLEKELSELMSLSPASRGPAPKIQTGIPSEPVPLPPDGELKLIRFTPIQDLLKIPCGNIVELSLDEVLLMHRIAKRELRCPRCRSKSDAMFWYQYSLVPDLSENTTVYMRCQYCGHDDYL